MAHCAVLFAMLSPLVGVTASEPTLAKATLRAIEARLGGGEPGGSDTYTIHTASGYTAGGALASGNIQVHN
jgi:hypothetical protein